MAHLGHEPSDQLAFDRIGMMLKEALRDTNARLSASRRLIERSHNLLARSNDLITRAQAQIPERIRHCTNSGERMPNG